MAPGFGGFILFKLADVISLVSLESSTLFWEDSENYKENQCVTKACTVILFSCCLSFFCILVSL